MLLGKESKMNKRFISALRSLALTMRGARLFQGKPGAFQPCSPEPFDREPSPLLQSSAALTDFFFPFSLLHQFTKMSGYGLSALAPPWRQRAPAGGRVCIEMHHTRVFSGRYEPISSPAALFPQTPKLPLSFPTQRCVRRSVGIR